MVKFCPACRKIHPIIIQKCPICGNSNLSRFCPECRKFVPDGARACPLCGDVDTSFTDSKSKSIPKKKSGSAFKALLITLIATGALISAVIFLPYLLDPCRSGHTWEKATCTSAKTCSICGERDGTALGHKWVSDTCAEPAVCSRCGEESYSEKKSHEYDTQGVCLVCGATKEYGNSYGYFSKSELFAMAKDAVENYAYPSYVSHYCSESEIIVEKVTDPKLEYSFDSYIVGAYADITINTVTYKSRKFAVALEPRSSTQYVTKDVYIQLQDPVVVD